MHAGEGPGPRGVDADNAGARVRAPHARRVKDTPGVDVVHEAAEALEETVVLVAPDPGADQARRHRVRREGITSSPLATCRLRQCLQRRLEAFPRGGDEPGADLAHARPAVGDAWLEPGKDRRPDDE